MKQVRLMTGNEACAEAAIVAGMRFFAGYPITPSSEIAEVLSKRLPEVNGVFIQMEDEIASMGAIIGASLAGVKSMTATSGPGFSLMQENIGYAAMAEVPVVVVDVQRGGPSTGLPTMPSQSDVMQARWGTHGDHPVIAVAPSTVQDTYEWTIKAFNFSEKYRVPVIILMDEIVGHLSEKIIIPDVNEIEIIDRVLTTDPPEEYLPYKFTENDIPPIAHYGTGYRFNVTGLSHDESGFPTNDPEKIDALYRRINRKIERYKKEIIYYKTELLEDADVCLVAYGSTTRSARRAVYEARAAGIKAGLFQIYVLWPFPYEELREISQTIKRFIIPEMNLGQIAHEVEYATRTDVIKVNRVDGNPVTPQEILKKIKHVSL
ncbi:MAG: 2-oxoacid:acceptor oxidoreductase subunit alpha [candidate division WOR-3 bacterium]|nr:2-oxoacid:acceptor oxidoreductase subunit alpha [candidate division WOR-3 bacterium]